MWEAVNQFFNGLLFRIIVFFVGYCATYLVLYIPVLGILIVLFYGLILALFTLTHITHGYVLSPAVFLCCAVLLATYSFIKKGGTRRQQSRFADFVRFLWYTGKQSRRDKQRKQWQKESQSLGGSRCEKKRQQKVWDEYTESYEEELREQRENLDRQRQTMEIERLRMEQQRQEWMNQRTRQAQSNSKMTKEKACQILGIRNTPDLTVTQVKKVVKRLMMIFHTDVSDSCIDQERIKDINLAYEYLKKVL